MPKKRDWPSDSGESDLDFKLSGEDESFPSEEESDGSVKEASLVNPENKRKVKRKKKQARPRRRKKMNIERVYDRGPMERILSSDSDDDSEETEDETQEKTEEVEKLTAEEEKKKTDSLWSDFMKDSKSPVCETHTGPGSSVHVCSRVDKREGKILSAPKYNSDVQKEKKEVVTKIYEFAGEKVKVEEKVEPQTSGKGMSSRKGISSSLLKGLGSGSVRGIGKGGGSGLSSLIGQLGKKNKLSTLEKSKLDWDRFKKEEGIEEDIQTHNKGKAGYLEKQDFLQRTDLRQFEIEKQLRTTSRSNK